MYHLAHSTAASILKSYDLMQSNAFARLQNFTAI